jgi:pilus assembly protein Flp/PilA
MRERRMPISLFSRSLNTLSSRTEVGPKSRKVGIRTSAQHQEWRRLAMRSIYSRFLCDRSGATAIEYALIAGAISIVIVGALTSVGNVLQATFINVNAGFQAN